jgi:hypothetical protein
MRHHKQKKPLADNQGQSLRVHLPFSFSPIIFLHQEKTREKVGELRASISHAPILLRWVPPNPKDAIIDPIDVKFHKGDWLRR